MAQYRRLTYAERQKIEQLKTSGKGVRSIARALGRSASTISTELKRRFSDYKASTAQKDAILKASYRIKERKITVDLEAMMVLLMTELRCSPEQICGHLRRIYSDRPEFHISPEAVYLWVYRHPARKTLVNFLRRKRKYRKAREARTLKRGGIINRVSIHERPAIIDDREEVGHWEGDLIIGERNGSAIGTLVERSSRYTILVKVNSKESSEVVSKFTAALSKLPLHLRRSLTYDNGTEMAFHEQLSSEIQTKVYFADPRSPWQRGSNENTNGLIREFFPKGTDLSCHSSEKLGGTAALLNRRPRKILGYKSPSEIFEFLYEREEDSLSVALEKA